MFVILIGTLTEHDTPEGLMFSLSPGCISPGELLLQNDREQHQQYQNPGQSQPGWSAGPGTLTLHGRQRRGLQGAIGRDAGRLLC